MNVGETTVDQLLDTINLRYHLIPFLESSGWQRVDLENRHWSVWHGEHDMGGEPLELLLPLEGSATERRAYLAKAVELLAAVRDESLIRSLYRIINYDRDVLFVRNLDTGIQASLPLERVIEQLSALKQMFVFAMSTERQPKPHLRQALPLAKRLMSQFSFGHTMPGSFVLNVSTPPISRVGPQVVQLPLAIGDSSEGDSDVHELVHQLNTPFLRRVNERLARGLLYSREADRAKNYEVLLREYGSGFNANLCDAVANVAGDGAMDVELQIDWSPVWPLAPDLATFGPVEVTKETCDNLRYVATQLKVTEPESATIVGNIRGLTVNANPGNPTSRRAVILYGQNPLSGRSASFVVELAKEDYELAIEAHKSWHRVQVSGFPLRTGALWRLSEPHDFTVIR